jgi:ABC-type dipeptide/oligopeptide/nickel transport system permease subunit
MTVGARESLDSASGLAFTPAGVMFVTVLAFNLVRDTVPVATDPRRGAS